MIKTLPLAQGKALPLHRRPVALLFLMSFAMPLAFATWNALLNNFVVEVAGFTGVEIGWLHTLREIPGFLSFLVIFVLMVMHEQVAALLALATLALATAVTAWFPTIGGIMTVTVISSIGFHYFEAVNQSLQLQWLTKDEAPKVLGLLVGAGSAASLISYGVLMVTFDALGLSYNIVYLVSGGLSLIIVIYCALAFPRFQAAEPQLKGFVLRRRYWLYYALQFMAGARRQIFVVFAAFMMVERFGFAVHEVTGLFLINFLANMLFAPLMGGVLARFGERRVLMAEYLGLIGVFLAYGGVYWMGWGVIVAATLYVIDHMLFGLAFALKTYFQKIADPQDIAPTAAVAFTINHIAAVFLPAALGYLWVVNPSSVFLLAAGMATCSLVLALLIPRHPLKGRETVLSGRVPVATAAE
ncbi:Major Facilitator Superfamily protein [Aquimixticola soesokkakensis]|uniref:Major Facilitator Superfamily protein n=1 Tax=Aquimixticola soesokkakensis TaxID=1519096 RepID=A0A1Y5S5B4_9RHOB|nr:MFS transporter [Aquimixticola soesokkakensis]SLN32852.1 Major Facilitator Superfamily protein [Aquimixticola soesokkakensis]